MPVRPLVHTVRAGDRLWDIAHDNENALLSAEEKQRIKAMSEDEITQMALADLIRINHFNPELQDGVVSNLPGDPDSIDVGLQLRVSR